MLAGLILTCAYLFTYLGIFFIPGTNLLDNTAANYLFGIPPTHFGPIGALANFAVRLRRLQHDRGAAAAHPGPRGKRSYFRVAQGLPRITESHRYLPETCDTAGSGPRPRRIPTLRGAPFLSSGRVS